MSTIMAERLIARMLRALYPHVPDAAIERDARLICWRMRDAGLLP